jgi:hypothetical protein
LEGPESNQVYDRILTPKQIGLLDSSPETGPFDGNARKRMMSLSVAAIMIGAKHPLFFMVKRA